MYEAHWGQIWSSSSVVGINKSNPCYPLVKHTTTDYAPAYSRRGNLEDDFHVIMYSAEYCKSLRRNLKKRCLWSILCCSDLISTSRESNDSSTRRFHPDPWDVMYRENWSCISDSLRRSSAWISALVLAQNRYLQRVVEICTDDTTFSLTGDFVVLPTNSHLGGVRFINISDLDTW